MTIAALSQNVDVTPRLPFSGGAANRAESGASSPPSPPAGGGSFAPADAVTLSTNALAAIGPASTPGVAGPPSAAPQPSVQGAPPPRPAAPAQAADADRSAPDANDQPSAKPAETRQSEAVTASTQAAAAPAAGIGPLNLGSPSGIEDARSQIVSVQADVQARGQPQQTLERASASQSGPVTTASTIAGDAGARAASLVAYSAVAVPDYGASINRGNTVNAVA